MDIHRFAALADSSNTQRAYGSDWLHFESWCQKKNKKSLPAAPDDVANYLRYCAEKLHLKISTVSRRIAAISEAHKRNRHESPTQEWVVRNTVKRLRRELGRPLNSKKPILVDDLKKMLAQCPPTLTGKRDKAVLLLCFAGAFKRSELVSLNVEDIAKADEGFVFTLKERTVAIPYAKSPGNCPIRAALDWMDISKIVNGPLFRAVTKNERPRMARMSDRVVAEIVKKYSVLIGKPVKLFSGHSLRAGLATSAALAGASEASIQKQTGHKSLIVLRKYLSGTALFRDNAAEKLDL